MKYFLAAMIFCLCPIGFADENAMKSAEKFIANWKLNRLNVVDTGYVCFYRSSYVGIPLEVEDASITLETVISGYDANFESQRRSFRQIAGDGPMKAKKSCISVLHDGAMTFVGGGCLNDGVKFGPIGGADEWRRVERRFYFEPFDIACLSPASYVQGSLSSVTPTDYMDIRSLVYASEDASTVIAVIVLSEQYGVYRMIQFSKLNGMPQVVRLGTGEQTTDQGFPKTGRTLPEIKWVCTGRCEWTELGRDQYGIKSVQLNMTNSMAESVTIAAVWQPLSKLGGNDFFTQARFQQEHANPSVYDRYFELVEAQLAKANQRKTNAP